MNGTKIFLLLFVGLAVGCTVWLGFFSNLHLFQYEISVEDKAAKFENRAAQYVAAEERPKTKLKIDAVSSTCMHIDKIDVDGEEMLVYSRNDCHRKIEFAHWRWTLLSPDGTSLKSNWINTGNCSAPDPGHKAECRMKLEMDDRAETLRVEIYDIE